MRWIKGPQRSSKHTRIDVCHNQSGQSSETTPLTLPLNNNPNPHPNIGISKSRWGPQRTRSFHPLPFDYSFSSAETKATRQQILMHCRSIPTYESQADIGLPETGKMETLAGECEGNMEVDQSVIIANSVTSHI